MAAKTVQAIDKKSIHQICSGQVVLNIATAVKELVENSLDAGATNIDIRLKDYGAEVLEVVDNGCGVEPCNFEALTLKHYTSKLQDFSDLTTVETFGFRGEALSSLCALSNLSIITHHSTQTAATRLEYDHNGNLVSKTPCARGVGTTVVLLNLFSTLPVRHKEFLRNIKKEFTKLVHVLQGYCLVSTGVRITCSNQVEKGKKTAVVSTNGSSHVKNNITCVFGPKQIQSLMVFDQIQPSEEDCSELGLDTRKLDKQLALFKISGFVSKPDHSMGRSSTDRQFFYINKRPCELSKVSRTVNEVYHMYNRHQFPFVMLDISLARDSVDVNVTPDKRQVFIQEEKLLLAILRTSLKTMFEPVAATFDLNQKPLTQIKLQSCVTQSMTSTGDSPEEGGTEHLYDSNKEEIEVVKTCTTPVTMSGLKRGVFPSLANFKRKFSSLDEDVDRTPKQPLAKQVKLTSIFSHNSKKAEKSLCVFEEEGLEDQPYSTVQGGKAEKFNTQSPSQDSRIEEGKCHTSRKDTESERHTLSSGINRNDRVDCPSVLEKALDQTDNMSPTPNQQENCSQSVVTLITPRRANPSINGVSAPGIAFCKERKEVTVSFSITELKNNTQTANKKPSTEFEARQFRARISPDCNANAEKELRKNVSKDMFSKMEILGQFNLGFIITKLGKDLFIVDQHASDEKFNFEEQQQTTTIRSQRLIAPQRLELTAVNEAILIDNIEIFQKNGFDFDIDENAEATNRVKLTSLPVSKNWTFGFEDVEELIFMLSDSPGVMCRPSRVRKMFASRACRMSIMVGTALNHTQMKKIVCHMGKIDHPWNCPHGRPTMRHLINLSMLPSTEQ